MVLSPRMLLPVGSFCFRALLSTSLLLLPLYGQLPAAEQLRSGHLRPKLTGIAAPLPAQGQAPRITYHGGPIMLGTTHIYYIWYGNWATDTTGVSILQDFATSIGESPYYTINTGYYNSSEKFVSKSVTFAGSTTDNYSQGSAAVIGQVRAINIVALAITSGRLPSDPNGVYFVLTSPDVVESSGFCGYHDHTIIGTTDIKYAVVGNKLTQGLDNCAFQSSTSPNGHPAADAMVNVVAHELVEAVTDPTIEAWFDSYGDENADKCAWTFGHTYSLGNGSKANVRLGARDYMIQQNWVNVGDGYCAMSLTSPVLSSVSPNTTTLGSSIQVLISGFNLFGASINPMPGVAITNVVTSSQLITATFTVAGVASLGGRNFTVTTVAGISNDLIFNVVPLAPVLTGISPPSSLRGVTIPVTITGSNLSGATINVGTGIRLSAVVSATNQITALFDIAADAPSAPMLITVNTLAGISNPVTFTINPAIGPPTLFSVNPSSGPLGTSFGVTITGTNFADPTVIRMQDGGSMSASGVTVVSSNLINATFTISNFASRRNSFAVQTALGLSNSLNFDVLPGIPNPPPILTAITPQTIGQGQSVPVTILGQNLSGASINPITGVLISNVVTSSNQITAIFNASSLGLKSVLVSNLNGISNTVTFQVTGTGPTLSSISPSSGSPGTSVPVTIFGSNLTGASVNSIAGVTVSTVITRANQLTATLNISSDATIGSRLVSVTAGGIISNPVSFTVTGAGPSISSINPSSGRQGTSLTVFVNGSNLIGASFNSIPGITISNVVSSPTALTAIFDISVGATVGPVNLSVTTPGVGTSNYVPFTIDAIRDRR